MQNLTIAEGTPVATTVRDCRGDYRWSTPGAPRPPVPPRAIIWHHTATPSQPDTREAQLRAMRAVADNGQYGLPYNFVIFAFPHTSIYYLNDVDRLWPHTYRWNDATAIALWGDWTIAPVPERVLNRGRRLVEALRSMWQQRVPTKTHREVFATICPGADLADAFGSTKVMKLAFGMDGAPPEMRGCPHGTGAPVHQMA